MKHVHNIKKQLGIDGVVLSFKLHNLFLGEESIKIALFKITSYIYFTLVIVALLMALSWIYQRHLTSFINILLIKFLYGVHDISSNWLISYLTDRKHAIKMFDKINDNYVYSKSLDTSTTVPPWCNNNGQILCGVSICATVHASVVCLYSNLQLVHGGQSVLPFSFVYL